MITLIDVFTLFALALTADYWISALIKRHRSK